MPRYKILWTGLAQNLFARPLLPHMPVPVSRHGLELGFSGGKPVKGIVDAAYSRPPSPQRFGYHYPR